MKNFNILTIPIFNGDYTELLIELENSIQENRVSHIITANAAMLVSALSDQELKKCLNSAEIITADGMSIVWAARFLGYDMKDRVTGIDSIIHIAQQAEERQQSIFFLGAKNEVLDAAIKKIKIRFPKLNIAGSHHGYFKNDATILELIQKSRPTILFVGMGFSVQEKWLNKYKQLLNVPIIMGVGGSFDVIAGRVSRAPVWVQKIGLEWFFRMIQEPGRLWKRYLVTNTLFIWKVISFKLFGKI